MDTSPNNLIYHIASIFRNASPFVDFRKLIVEENAMTYLYSSLHSCKDDKTLEKFLQALLILICDHSFCDYSTSIFSFACYMSLNPLTHLLDSDSPKVLWILMKIMNFLTSVGM